MRISWEIFEILRKSFTKPVIRLVLLIVFATAIFSYGSGRFIFVKADSERINIFPETFNVEQNGDSYNWQSLANAFYQDLSDQAEFEQFNKTNSAFIFSPRVEEKFFIPKLPPEDLSGTGSTSNEIEEDTEAPADTSSATGTETKASESGEPVEVLPANNFDEVAPVGNEPVVNDDPNGNVPADANNISDDSETLPAVLSPEAPAPSLEITPAAGSENNNSSDVSFFKNIIQGISSFISYARQFNIFDSKLAKAQDDVIASSSDGQPTPQNQSIIFSNFSVQPQYKENNISSIKLRLSLAALSDLSGDKLYIEYNLGNSWLYLGELDLYNKISNFDNGDYFSYQLPAEIDWEKLDKLKIKVSYHSDQAFNIFPDAKVSVYLDSLWLEADYFDASEEEVLAEEEITNRDYELTLLEGKENYKSDEHPGFKFRFQKKRGLLQKIGAGLIDLFHDEYRDINIKMFLRKGGKTVPEDAFVVKYLADGEISVERNLQKRLQPGKYSLEIIVREAGQKTTITQDFIWGVLAFNPNKTIYLPAETAYLQMAVLDDLGNTLCQVKSLELEITAPDGGVAYLNTDNSLIISNPECGPNNLIANPDFYAYYGVGWPGTYYVTVRAQTANGERTTSDVFEVRDSLPFAVERIGPTRIYPIADYKMKIKVKVTENFIGDIIESVPLSFKIKNAETRKQKVEINEYSDHQEIRWKRVRIMAGREVELSYVFDAPNISPEFYLLGPLNIANDGIQTPVEIRQWQIASDADSEIGHIYANYNGELNHTFPVAEIWWERTEYMVASTSFTAGDKYLLAMNFSILSDNANYNPMARVLHGTTPFDDSQFRWESRRAAGGSPNPLGNSYEYFTVWQAVAGEDIHVELSGTSSGIIVYTEDYEFMAINLSHNLTQNTDWFFATSTQSGNLPTGASWSNGASVSFNGGGNDWMILGLGRFLADDTTSDFLMRINDTTDSLAYSPVRYETEDADDYLPTMITIGTTTTGMKTWQVEAQADTAATHDWASSSIFALNLSKFQDHSITYNTNANSWSSGVGTWTATTSASYAVTETGDHLIWSMEAISVNTEDTKNIMTRIRLDGTVVPTGHNDAAKILPNGATDINSAHSMYIGNMATGTRQIDVSLQEQFDQTPAPVTNVNSLIIFSMEMYPIPNAPALHDVPFDNEETPDTTPNFEFTGDDPAGSKDLIYEISWSTDYAFTSSTTRNSVNNAGFTDTVTASTSPAAGFADTHRMRFTVQAGDALANSAANAAYYWRVRTKTAGNGWSAWTPINSFRVNTSLNWSRWLQTTDVQFAKNIFTNTATSGANSVKTTLNGTAATSSWIAGTAGTNWTVPPWVTGIVVKSWGAGGGGGAGGNGAAGAAGGGGGYANTTLTVTPGETLSIRVGGGGGNGVYTGAPTWRGTGGGGGGYSSIMRGATFLLQAGAGGGGGAGSAAGETGGAGGAGGGASGLNGTRGQNAGCGGGAADVGAFGSAGTTSGGAGGTTCNSAAGGDGENGETDGRYEGGDGGNGAGGGAGGTNGGGAGGSYSAVAGYAGAGGGGGGYFGGGGGEMGAAEGAGGGGGGSATSTGSTFTLTAGLNATPGNPGDSARAAYCATAGNGGTAGASTGNGGSGIAGCVVVSYTLPATSTVLSAPIDVDWMPGYNWKEFSWSEDESSGSTSVRLLYDSNDNGDCDTVVPDGALAGNTAYFSSGPKDISGLSTSTYYRICMEAALLGTSANSPFLLDWYTSWDVPTPQPPVLHDIPFKYEETPDTTPNFEFTGSGVLGGLTYEISWSTSSDFTASTTRNSVSNAGFTDTITSDVSPLAGGFTSGDRMRFTVQPADALANSAANTAYYWRVRAKTAYSSWSSWAETRSFRVNTSLSESRWVETTDWQFGTGVFSGTATSGANSVKSTSTVPSTSTYTSDPVDLAWGLLSYWKQFYWMENEATGTVAVQLLYDSDNNGTCDAVVPNNDLPGNLTYFATGTIDISDLATSTYYRLCLKAQLTITGTSTPYLNDWTIEWGNGPPTFMQSAYRWFESSTTTAAVIPLTSSQDQIGYLTAPSQQFRLRALLHVGNLNSATSSRNFKLQYGAKGSGDCSDPQGGWSDVATSSAISYYDTTGISDGTAIIADAHLTHGSDTIRNQAYEEENNFTNSISEINIGQDGKWDFSLYDNNATASTSYCFRVTKSNGAILTAYNVRPEIVTSRYLTVTAIEQYKSDLFTTIANQGWTAENEVNLYGVAIDYLATTSQADFYYEVRDESGSFITNNTSAPSSFCSSGTAYDSCSSKVWKVSDVLDVNNWYNNNWTYRKKITINSSQVATTTTGFPVLATTTDSLFAYTAFGGHMGSSTGADIVITDTNGTTTLSYEREYYSSSTGQIALWIKTDISAVANKELYIYYGNPAITTDQSTTTGVWDNNYMMVQHLDEVSGAGNYLLDSTKNSNNGAPGGTTPTHINNAQIDGGWDFAGANQQRVEFPDSATLRPTSALTASGWAKADSWTTPDHNPVFWKGTQIGWGANYLFRIAVSAGAPTWGVTCGATEGYFVGGAVSLGSWYHYVLTYNGVDSIAYINGIQVGTANTCSGVALNSMVGSPLRSGFGYRSTGVEETHWDGQVDELRLQNTARTAGWIQTEFNNQSNVSNFLSFAAIEEDRNTLNYESITNIISIPERGSIADSSLGYKWQLLACDNYSNCSLWDGFNSNLPNFKVDITHPAPPGNLTLATTSPTSITVLFGSSGSDTNFDRYRIFYKQGIADVDVTDTEHADTNLGFIDYNTATTTEITGLQPSTQYVINIWAYDKAGNYTGATEIQVTTAETPHARARSVQYFGGAYSGNGTTGLNTNTDYTFNTFNFKLAETDAVIRNAYIIFDARVEAYNDNAINYSGYKLAFDTCADPCTANAFSGIGSVTTDDSSMLAYDETESNQVRLLLDVTNEAQLADYNGNSAEMEAQIGYQIKSSVATNSIAFAQAALVVTYSYVDSLAGDITNTVIYPLESAVSGDRGTTRASTIDDCVKNSTCPLFNYQVDIPEYSTSLSRWFNLQGVNDVHGSNDVTVNVNIQGTNVDSNTYIHEAANDGEQGFLPSLYFDNVQGFAPNTAQQLEYYLASPGAATYYLLGGEAFETYTANKSAPTKTRTVSFPVGIITVGQSTATASGTAQVYFPENGNGTGIVDIKKAWFRVIGNDYDNAVRTITISTQVGNNSQSSNSIYNINASDMAIEPVYRIIHVIPSSDYTELETANSVSAKAVMLNATLSNINLGGLSAELLITYAYTDESSGYLTSLDLYGGQSFSNGNSQNVEVTPSKSVLPEIRGDKTVRGSALLPSYALSASSGGMPNTWFTLDANLATASPVCTNAFYHHDDAINSFTEFYRNVTPSLATTDDTSYSVCISNTNGVNANAGAKMNSIWRYIYQWDAPPPELTENDWRWYENIDGIQPTTAKAAQNTAITGVNIGDVLRMRINVGVTNSDIATSTQSFKLQYGYGLNCTTINNWTDVGGLAGTESWIGYNNPSPADGSSLSTNLLSISNKAMSYEETNSSASNPKKLATGEFGEWDWVIYNNSATSTIDYCFKMVKADGTDFYDYLSDSYPKLTTAASNTAPNLPNSLGQYKNDNTVITNGAWINESTVKLKAAVIDPNINEVVSLYFQFITATGTLTTATTVPIGACVYGTAYNPCTSKVWYATSSLGDYRTNSYIGTTSITSIPGNSSGYKWQVLACDDSGACSSWTQPGVSPNIKIDLTPPSPPGSLIFATSTPTTIKLNFGASTTEANFSRYRVYYKMLYSGVTEYDIEHSDSNLLYKDYNATTSTILTGLSANTKYVFNIWAYDLAGNKATATSETIGTTTVAFNPPFGYTMNSTAQLTDGSGVVDWRISVTDPDNDQTVRAKVMYQLGNTCNFTSAAYSDPTIDPTDENVTATFGDPDVDNNYPYQIGTTTGWIITALVQNYVYFDWQSMLDIPAADGTFCLGLVVNDGMFDQVATHTKTLIIDNVKPTVPGNLSLASRNNNSVTLAFGASSTDTNFDEYKIFYKVGTTSVTEADQEFSSLTNPGDTHLGTANYGGAATTTITGLTANTDYVFNIWAYDTHGNRASSSIELTVKTNAVPTNISADNQYKSDNLTAIANNGWTNEASVVLRASAHDQNAADSVTFYYEVITATGTFTTTAQAPSNPCSSGTAYGPCPGKIWAVSTTTSVLPASWYSGAWLYRQLITINASKIPADQTGYPVLATTTSSDLAAKARADGYDIIFTASDGTTTIPYEREYYNTANGQLAAWIKTNISSTTNTILYMYYGNSGATTDISTTTGVWGNNYKGVWHLSENVVDESSQAAAHHDSTQYGNNGYQYGNNEVTNWIYQGQEFDGINDYIHIGNTGNNIKTISFWIKPGSANEKIIDLDSGAHTVSLVNNKISALGFANPTYYIDGQATTGPSVWYNSSWGFRKKITINSSQVATTTTGFPVLATTTDSLFAYTAFGGHMGSSTGADIVITDTNGTTTLSYEREYYSSSTGQIALWIKTDISAVANKELYIYYGNPAITTDQSTTTGVWDNNYMMVQHLDEVSGAGNYLLDSTKNSNNGAPGGTTPTHINNAQIDGGWDFAGANQQRVEFPDSATLRPTSALTASGWAKADSWTTPDHNPVFWKGTQIGWGANYLFRIAVSAGAPTWGVTCGATEGWFAGGAVSLGSWYHYVLTYNGVDSIAYLNGVQVGTANTCSGVALNALVGSPLRSGLAYRDTPATETHWDGQVDELRLQNTARTAGWIQTEYNNQKSTSNFMNFSQEESNTAGIPINSTSWHNVMITTNSAIAVNNMDIGRIGSNYFNGSLDEVELYDLYATTTWVTTFYNNQSAVNNFMTFSSQSEVTSYYGSVLVISIPDNPSSATGYKWQVKACDDDSDCSAWEVFNVTTPNFKVDTINPTAPGQLTESSKTSNRITFGFGSPTQEDNFVEYRIFYSTSSPVKVADTEHNDTDLDFKNYNSTSNTSVYGLVPNTTYYFNIWAYDIVNRQASSTVTAVTTNQAVATPGVLFYSRNDLAVYYRVWNGTSWGAEASSTNIMPAGYNIRQISAVRSDDGGKVGLLLKTWNSTNQRWYGVVYRQAANDFVNTTLLGAQEADATNNHLLTGCIASLSGGEFFVIRNNNAAAGTLAYSWNPATGWTDEGAGPGSTAAVAVMNGCKLVRRPGTDNYILTTFDDDSDIGTVYYKGSAAYDNTNWTNWTEHSTNEEDIENFNGDAFFDPSNNIRGAITYKNSTTNNYAYAKYFSCDGASISYGSEVAGPSTAPYDWNDDFVHGEFSSDPGGVGIAYFAGRDITGQLNIYKVDASSSAIIWATSTNGDNISSGNLYSQTGYSQKPFAIDFYRNGNAAIVGNYAATNTPFYSVITTSGNSLSATSSVQGATANIYSRVRMYDDPNEDEFLAVWQNDDIDYAAAFWDSGLDSFYSAGNQAWTELATTTGAANQNYELTSYAYTKYNTAPNAPTNLVQYRSDASTTIANGAWANENTVKFTAAVVDYDTSEIVTLYLQLFANPDTFATSTSRPVSACEPAITWSSCLSKTWVIATSSAGDYSYTSFTATATISSIDNSNIGYKWQVIACDDSGACSAWSKFNLSAPNFYVDWLAPTAPGQLVPSAKTSTSVTLNFGASTTEDNFYRYRIFYASSTPVTENSSEQVDSDLNYKNYNGTTNTVVSGLSPLTLYYFNIWAYDLAGNKASSTIVSTTTGDTYKLYQVSYLLENDDGANVNLNSAEVASNTPLNNLYQGERLNVRIQIQNTGGDTATSKVYKLQFENQTASSSQWFDVGAATEISYSLGLSGDSGNSLTSRKAAINSNTWANGYYYENTNLSGAYTLANGSFTEFVFAVQTRNAILGHTYRWRLYNNTDVRLLDGYTSTSTISISATSSLRYSKGASASLLTTAADLTYFLDPEGYVDVVANDDANRDPLTSASNYPVFNFALKNIGASDAITTIWNGSSTVAASALAVYLQVYRFGSTNAWQTVATNTVASANIDFTLNATINSSLSEYYGSSNWAYWRVYQSSGTETLSTDYINIATSTPVPDVKQVHYRWRYDNGSEAAATWMEAEDIGSPTAGLQIGKGSSTRLRIAVANVGGGSATNYIYRLEYASSSDGCASEPASWVVLPATATTQHFEMATSSYYVNGDSTSAHLTGGGLTFVAGTMVEDPSSTSSAITIIENRYTEIEYMILVTNNATNAGTYCFRVTNSGSLLDSYSIYPTVTLSGNTNNAPSFSVPPSDTGSASTAPTDYSENVNFAATALDADNNNYYLAVCRTNSITPGNDTAPTCNGGSWCLSNSTASGTQASCIYTAATSTEDNAWWAFVCDKVPGFGIAKCSTGVQGSGNPANDSPFVINHPPNYTLASTTDNYKNPGENFTVTAYATDNDMASSADTLRLYVCTTNSADYGTGCEDATLCSILSDPSPDVSCSFSAPLPASAGSSTYYAFVYDSHALAASPASRSATYTINNALPTFGSLILNNNNIIELGIQGAPDTAVSAVIGSVEDINGCQSLVSAIGTIYLATTTDSYNCGANNNYCYQATSSACVISDCASSTDMTAAITCTTNMKYYAIPTDNTSGNPYTSYDWRSYMLVFDGYNYKNATSTGVELSTNLALAVAESLIDFGGDMFPGDNTGLNNSTSTIINAGNCPLDTNISGTDLNGNPPGLINVEYIKWESDYFDYELETNFLTETNQLVDIIAPRATTTTLIEDQLYWGIGIPFGATAAIYYGQNNFQAIVDASDW